MKRFLKFFGIFIVLLVISGVLLLRSVNSERNKTAIREAVLAASGYELIIAGDLRLDFFPTLGLILNDVRLRNPAYPQELASTTAATLKIDLSSVFSGNFIIQEFSADDFHVNYFIDAQGNNIWAVDHEIDHEIGHEIESVEVESDIEGKNQQISTLSFERVRIANASIDFQDLTSETRYSINRLNLDSVDSNIEGRPFSITLAFDFLNNGMSEPLPMVLSSDVVADINEGAAKFSDINFSVTPMLLTGGLTVNANSTSESLSINGNIESNAFDLIGLMETLGLRQSSDEFIINNSSRDDSLLSFNLNFLGNENELSFPVISASFGQASIEGDASVRMATEFAPPNISFNIRSSAIDISPFLATENESVATVNTPATTQETELPFEILNTLTVFGSVSIESLTAGDLYFSDINLFANIEDGFLDIEIQPIQAYEGYIRGIIRVDGRKQDAAISSQFSIERLNLTALTPLISRFNSVSGKLNVEMDHKAQGSSTDELLNSLNGSTTFAIEENSVDIGVIKQVFTAIVALSPGGEAIQQWPDVIQFNELSGYILMQEGLKTGQQVKLRMDNFDISGEGGIDLSAGNFDYDLLFTVLGEPQIQTIQINELYHGVSWPVQCSAAFDNDVSQYCGPDFTQAREIFTQIGGNAIRSRLNEVITDQLPTELQDSARGLLRNLFN